MDDPKSLAEAVGREFREVREGTIPRLRPMVGDTAADIPDEERWGGDDRMPDGAHERHGAPGGGD